LLQFEIVARFEGRRPIFPVLRNIKARSRLFTFVMPTGNRS